MTRNCFICGGDKFSHNLDYMICRNCGHQILVDKNAQGYIINDILCKDDVLNINLLDRFKNKIIFQQISPKTNNLLDLGSASGRLLYQNKDKFETVTGLEVTNESIDFSRNILQLEIISEARDIKNAPDLITAFHTLEHIPASNLKQLILDISQRSNGNEKFIISVPNANSILVKILGRKFAFYDVPNHLHQFSELSLDRLMKKYGYSQQKKIFSFIYEIFCILQTVLNVMNSDHNYLYYSLKRRQRDRNWLKVLFELCKLIFVVPFSILLLLAISLFKEKNSVITKVYQR